jgi:hypothetical protein
MKKKTMLEEIWGIPEDSVAFCDCGALAKWMYGPGYESGNPFYCDECVSRGCSLSCNSRYTSKFFKENDPENIDMAEEPNDLYPWKWIKEGYEWESTDEFGRPFPCADFVSLESARTATLIEKQNPQ